MCNNYGLMKTIPHHYPLPNIMFIFFDIQSLFSTRVFEFRWPVTQLIKKYARQKFKVFISANRKGRIFQFGV